MADPTETTQGHANSGKSLSDLPTDELAGYGCDLGLDIRPTMSRGQIVQLVLQRQALLDRLEHDALLDICVWARRPVRQSAEKAQLAKEIAKITRMDFAGLSRRGLVALAQLRGLDIAGDEPTDRIIRHMRRAEPLSGWLRRKRRSAVASIVSHALQSASEDTAESGEYQFLPEDHSKGQLKQQIKQKGLVGGIASSLRGAADDYVSQKLDEIEHRIDAKLDQIDHRLSAWRDQEITNRLRIIKITLIASILVAMLSLGYKHLDQLLGRPSRPHGPQPTTQGTVEEPDA
jgi:hypothetical protein